MMQTGLESKCQIGLSLLATVALAVSCATTSSTQSKGLKPTIGGKVDLSSYQVATVLPFQVPADKKIDQSVGAKFSDDIATRLQYDFGQLFREVRKGPHSSTNDELIVTGIIRAYEPGSKFARFMLIGAGAASFKGNLILKDASNDRVLLNAPFDKLWAWGGILGASKDIQDMEGESAAAVANTIARAKGWRPPPASSGSK